MANTPRPVLIMNSVLAAAGVLLGGGALTNYLSLNLVGLLALILAAVQVGWGLYVQGAVTPNEAVAAIKPDPTLAAVVAFDGAKNIPNGTPVELVRSDPAPFG